MTIYNFSDPSLECYECQFKDGKLDDMRYWLRAIMEHLYGDQPLDNELLDHCMDELTNLVGIRLTERKINVERKKQKASIQPIEDWIEFNNNYLKQL